MYITAPNMKQQEFFTPKFYYLPIWADAEKLTLSQAVQS
jgi:hypothetical protein